MTLELDPAISSTPLPLFPEITLDAIGTLLDLSTRTPSLLFASEHLTDVLLPIRFPTIWIGWVTPLRSIPLPRLPEMMLPAPVVVPPIVTLLARPATAMPSVPLPGG